MIAERSCAAHDGICLRYYVTERTEDRSTLVITSAPGMSIKFWLPIIDLLQSRYAFLLFDYRGFPKKLARQLTQAECQFHHLVTDLATIIEDAGVECANFVSWCSGTKIMLEFYAQHPERVMTMSMLNPAFQTGGGMKRSDFSRVLYGLIDKVERDEGSIERVLKLMRSIGEVPNADFFDYLKQEDLGFVHALDLADLLMDESSYSNLAFYMIDDARTLRNYLRIYERINKRDVGESFLKIEIPTLLLMGKRDKISYLTLRDVRYVAANRWITVKEIEGGSHFMLIEYPKRVAAEIDEHIATAVTT